DGLTDIIVSEDDVFTWNQSRGFDGFTNGSSVRKPRNEEQGPRIVFADREQSIYLADMSGDGLSDILRIRNGSVYYWPNLGYGKFGAKVLMDNSPQFDIPDRFNQKYIR